MKATRSGNFKVVPLPEPQTAFARAYSVIDIGTVPNYFQNKFTGNLRKIYITWEFPSLLAMFNEDKGEQPFVIGLELTAVTGENSNLAKLVSQWRNKPFTEKEQESFDPSVMIGKPCFISFIHKRKAKWVGKDIHQVTNDNSNLKFNGIMPVPKDVKLIPAVNPYFNWDWDKIEKEGFNKEEFEKIPKWLRIKMATSQEFKTYAGSYQVVPDGTSTEEESTPSAPVTGNIPPTEKIGDDW